MKKLFVQFYLLLFVCFLVMTMLVGLVYKFTAERAGRQSLDDLMKSSLYLMRSELREIPPRDWSKTLKELDLNLSFDLHIEPMSKFKLSESSMQHLRRGYCRARRPVHLYPAHSPQPLCAVRGPGALSLFSA
jgi:two-component system sensor histidine kinase RstB